MFISQSAIAAEGYYVPHINETIYSVEELVYLCMHRGYALDKDFPCKKLVQWVDEQCGCEDLAYRLDDILTETGDETAFLETILRFAGYISEAEISQVITEISEGIGLSGLERAKLDADNLYRCQKYVQAAGAYEALLKIVPKAETTLRAACYYNLAAARAQMFLYEQAMEALEASYQLCMEEDVLMTWLAAARMFYSEKQYLELIADREDLYELSLQVEEQVKNVEAVLPMTMEGLELEKLREWMQYGGKDGYYVASGRVLKTLCEEYRRYHD